MTVIIGSGAKQPNQCPPASQSERHPDLSKCEIANQLGISSSGLIYCLRALIDKGWLKVQNFSQSKNKFGYIYVLTPSGISQKAAFIGQFFAKQNTGI